MFCFKQLIKTIRTEMIRKVGLRRIKIFFILITMVFFISCQKDDEASPPLSNTIRAEIVTNKVTVDEIPEIMDFLATKGNSRGQFTITKLNNDTRSNEPDLVIGVLQTKEIIEVIDQYDRKNYTFLLTSIEGTDPTVQSTFNLIVKESSEGLFSYIMEYRPDANWTPDYLDKNYLSTFIGDVVYYTIDGIYIAKANLVDGVSISAETRNSCPDDGNGNGNGESTSDNSDSSDTTTNTNPSVGGIDAVEITVVCGCSVGHEGGGEACGSCDPSEDVTIIEIKSSINNKIDKLARNPCPPEDTPEFCHESNGDPCDCNVDGTGCAEGTNTDVAVLFESDPCEKISNALNDINVSDSITDLDGAFTEPNERGYGVSKNPDTSDFTTAEVLGGRRSTPLPIGGDIVGAAHIHTDGGYPMFSGDDIANIFLLYFRNSNRNHPDNPVRPDDIFSYLEASVGSFFITVNNPSALSALVGTQKRFDKLRNKLNRAYRKSDPNSQSDFIKAFFKTVNTLLEDGNTSTNALRMFRLNSDNTTLVEMTLDENGEVEETPCN